MSAIVQNFNVAGDNPVLIDRGNAVTRLHLLADTSLGIAMNLQLPSLAKIGYISDFISALVFDKGGHSGKYPIAITAAVNEYINGQKTITLAKDRGIMQLVAIDEINWGAQLMTEK